MGIGEGIWIFFLLMMLQPMLARWVTEVTRKRLLARIEQARGSRVIALIHRQETMSFFGFPIFRFIDINDAEEVLRAIHLTDPNVPLDIILHTPGGLVLASLQIARALKHHEAKVTVFVPHYAMSGGTLIALAADEIVLCHHAVLGPVDPQVGQFPAASILRAVEQKPIARVRDETLILADQSRKALEQVKASVQELIGDRFAPDQAEKLANLLTQGTWTHDHPITASEAAELGLPISTEMPEDILTMMRLYPQPTRHVPSVEYLPIPRHLPPAHKPQ